LFLSFVTQLSQKAELLGNPAGGKLYIAEKKGKKENLKIREQLQGVNA
jgi:hypothetical protein